MAEERQKARDAALHYLSARARSLHEVRQKLLGKGFGEDLVEEVLRDLQRLKLVDDREFARRWIESRLQGRPAGARKFAQDLRRKGIDREVVDAVLAEFAGEMDTAAAAADILRRQGWRYRDLQEEKAKRRMLGLLARRGYEPDQAREAVEDVWKEWQSDEV